jgi:hypothetical protein
MSQLASERDQLQIKIDLIKQNLNKTKVGPHYQAISTAVSALQKTKYSL